MKKLFALIVLVLLGFYVGWPAYTGYAIHAALEAEDSAVLERKIDFPQVRSSIRGPVMVKLDSRIGELIDDFGVTLGVTRDQIKMERIHGIVDGALDDVVSPERLGEIYKRGGDFTGAIQQAVLRQVDQAGGLMELLDLESLGGSQDDDASAASGGGFDLSNGIGGLLKNKKARNILGQVMKQVGANGGLSADALFPKRKTIAASDNGDRSFDFSNVKHFGFAGPLAMELGVARDRDAIDPDVTARMSFQDMDWKVTRLTPNL